MNSLEKDLAENRTDSVQGSHPLFFEASDRALVRMVGDESLDLLHRISTNEMLSLELGASRQTILTSEKGRMIEVVSVFRQSKQELILAGTSREPAILTHWLSKFIIMEDVRVVPVSESHVQVLIPGYSDRIFNTLKSDVSQNIYTMTEVWQNATWTRLIVPGSFDQCRRVFIRAGFGHGSDVELEAARIADGIPSYPAEIVEFNPLEAGLKHLVSFSKGCYVGQEVIARLDTYEKIQRSLRRIKLSEKPSKLPAPIYVEGEEAGEVTSVSSMGPLNGLGFISRKFQDRNAGFVVENRISIEIYPN